MATAGIFDDVNDAISYHPGTSTSVLTYTSLANYAATFKLTEKQPHHI